MKYLFLTTPTSPPFTTPPDSRIILHFRHPLSCHNGIYLYSTIPFVQLPMLHNNVFTITTITLYFLPITFIISPFTFQQENGYIFYGVTTNIKFILVVSIQSLLQLIHFSILSIRGFILPITTCIFNRNRYVCIYIDQ